jgi:protein kinase C substrate 80K-H
MPDCCDGSDEYNSSAQCVNTCDELGRAMREERERQARLLEEGTKIRNEYIEQSKRKLEENKAALEEMKKQKEHLEAEKNAKDALKKDAEEKEKAALDKFNSIQDQVKKQREEEEMRKSQEEDRKIAEVAFKEMDLNQDNLLSYTEVQQFKKFDKDEDGVVSEEEAKVETIIIYFSIFNDHFNPILSSSFTLQMRWNLKSL